MLFLKKILFSKKVYPVFFENLMLAKKNDSAVIFFSVENNILLLLIIINFKAVIFKKVLSLPMEIKTVTFNKELTEFDSEAKDLILKLKDLAIISKNHNFIENFSETINKVKIVHNLTLEEQHKMWSIVLNIDPCFFNSNEQKKSPTDINNKWVD